MFRGTLDSLKQALVEGWPFDLASGEVLKFLPAVDNQGSIEIGNGTTDMDLKVFMGSSGYYVLFDVSAARVYMTNVNLDVQDLTVNGELAVTSNLTQAGNTEFHGEVMASGAATIQGFNKLTPDRYELKWVAGERGKPGIPADAVDNTTATFAVTDPLFEITGTNGASALCTRDTTGGITLTTATTGNDQMILGPHTETNLSPWKSTAWLTNTSVEWETVLKTGADIVNSIIWAGLKLTSTPTVATDDDQIFFRYETTVNGNQWQLVSSRGGTDTTTNTTVAVANSTAVHLRISIQDDLTAKCYINGTLVNTAAALVTNKSLIPFIGIQTKDAAAAAVTVRGQAISKAIS